jgi:hypothetical protein
MEGVVQEFLKSFVERGFDKRKWGLKGFDFRRQR